jgi:hypothetical protein
MEDENSTPIYRHIDAEDGPLITTPDKDIKNMQDVFLSARYQFPFENYIGTRKQLGGGKLGEFEYKTYEEIETKARRFGSGLINLNLIKA